MLVCFNADATDMTDNYVDIFDSADNTVEKITREDVETLINRGIKIEFVNTYKGIVEIPWNADTCFSKIVHNDVKGITILESRLTFRQSIGKRTLIFYKGELVYNLISTDLHFAYCTGTDVWLNFISSEQRYLYINCTERKLTKDLRVFDMSCGDTTEKGLFDAVEHTRENGHDITRFILKTNFQSYEVDNTTVYNVSNNTKVKLLASFSEIGKSKNFFLVKYLDTTNKITEINEKIRSCYPSLVKAYDELEFNTKMLLMSYKMSILVEKELIELSNILGLMAIQVRFTNYEMWVLEPLLFYMSYKIMWVTMYDVSKDSPLRDIFAKRFELKKE